MLEKSIKWIPLFSFNALLQHRKVHILLKQQRKKKTKTINTDLFNIQQQIKLQLHEITGV